MNYRGYEIKETKSGIEIDGVHDFNLSHTFDCGQCFRWIKQENGSYTGVVKDKVANVQFENEKLYISNSSFEDFVSIWFEYFDLGTDYSKIKSDLLKDEIMQKALSFGSGMRLLRQDIWELVISFIISANNMIPRIMKSVELLSKIYGSPIVTTNGDFYSFPTPSALFASTIEQISICKAGFRCKYIHGTAKMILDKKIDLYSLDSLNTSDARKELIKLPGVGQKVAECVLLFSGTKFDVFPTDVWIKRIIEALYLKKDTPLKDISSFADNYFGKLSGYAQQYLFYYARENKIL